jgi:integrating conjugative element membrane protein (TIGR03747 family)
MPVGIVGALAAALAISVFTEFACMAFLWPDKGAAHSYNVMIAESRWLSGHFTRSLLLSEPVVSTARWVHALWHWLSGCFSLGNNLTHSQPATTGNVRMLSALDDIEDWLLYWLGEYLKATAWVILIFFIRVIILFLSLPLFGLAAVTGIVEGLVRRDLRRYGAGYESSFVYHHAKRLFKPALYGPCMLYLAWPTAVWPDLFLLPAALLTGVILSVSTATFKKYL